MKNILIVYMVILVFNSVNAWAKDSLAVKSVPYQYLNQIKSSSLKYEKRIDGYTAKTLSRLLRHERVLKAKLNRIDPEAANRLFDNHLQELQSEYKQKISSNISGSGFLDTTQLTLRFLNDNRIFQENQIGSILQQVSSLQGKLEMTEKLNSYMSERVAQLAELSKYKAISKELNDIKKEAYYYREQLSEYKSLFEDRQKIANKTIELLKKIPAYNEFLLRNSQIASLFNLGTDYNNLRNLEGLQLRSEVEQMIAQRVGDAPGGSAMVSSLINQGSEKLKEIRTKFPNLDNAAQMPTFKPNEMKKKRVIDRFEPGGNLQFQKSNYYFPLMADLAGQIAYRFHKNGSIGVGASYRLGMGEGWQKIHFSHQGLGLRSFADWKLKGTFYLNGGFELTRTTGSILNAASVKDWNGWVSSALIGINRKQKIGPKLKLNTMVLYDFLASQQPKTDRIKVRIGYTL